MYVVRRRGIEYHRKAFNVEGNTHITAIVPFRFSEGPTGEPVANNYIVTAYQQELG